MFAHAFTGWVYSNVRYCDCSANKSHLRPAPAAARGTPGSFVSCWPVCSPARCTFYPIAARSAQPDQDADTPQSCSWQANAGSLSAGTAADHTLVSTTSLSVLILLPLSLTLAQRYGLPLRPASSHSSPHPDPDDVLQQGASQIARTRNCHGSSRLKAFSRFAVCRRIMGCAWHSGHGTVPASTCGLFGRNLHHAVTFGQGSRSTALRNKSLQFGRNLLMSDDRVGSLFAGGDYDSVAAHAQCDALWGHAGTGQQKSADSFA